MVVTPRGNTVEKEICFKENETTLLVQGTGIWEFNLQKEERADWIFGAEAVVKI